MIAANELRIGNWVNGGVNYQMKAFDFTNNDFSKTSPIPLTPEILESAGFKLKDKNYEKGVWYLSKGEDDKWLFGEWYQGCYAVIQYLHELQNLFFALTKTELIISLTSTNR